MTDGLAMLAVVFAVLGVRSGPIWCPAAILAVAGVTAIRAFGQASWLLGVCAAVLVGVGWLASRRLASAPPATGWAETGACALIAIALLMQAGVGASGSAASLPLLLVGLWTIVLGRTAHGGVVAILAGVLASSERLDVVAALAASVVLATVLGLSMRPVPVSARQRRVLCAASGACGLVLVALPPAMGLAWSGVAIATGSTLALARLRQPHAPCVAGLAMMLFGMHAEAPFAQPSLLAGIVLNGSVLLACGRDRLVAMAAVLVMDAGLWIEIARAPSRLALPLGLAITAWAAWRLQRAASRRVLALAAVGHGGIVLAGCGLGPWALVVPMGHMACHAMVHAASLLGGRRVAALALAGLPPAGLFFTQALFLRWAADAGWVLLPAAGILTGFAWALMQARPAPITSTELEGAHPGLAWAPWAGSAALGYMLWQAGR